MLFTAESYSSFRLLRFDGLKLELQRVSESLIAEGMVVNLYHAEWGHLLRMKGLTVWWCEVWKGPKYERVISDSGLERMSFEMPGNLSLTTISYRPKRFLKIVKRRKGISDLSFARGKHIGYDFQERGRRRTKIKAQHICKNS